jgi:hypothetical protein
VKNLFSFHFSFFSFHEKNDEKSENEQSLWNEKTFQKKEEKDKEKNKT